MCLSARRLQRRINVAIPSGFSHLNDADPRDYLSAVVGDARARINFRCIDACVRTSPWHWALGDAKRWRSIHHTETLGVSGDVAGSIVISVQRARAVDWGMRVGSWGLRDMVANADIGLTTLMSNDSDTLWYHPDGKIDPSLA